MTTTTPSPAAAARAGHRLGFTTLEREGADRAIPVEGELPAWLTGSLVRTAPARFEVGERPLRHWFDGLAMLHRFTFRAGRVSYANRYLETRAHRAASERGEIAFSEFATDPCRALWGRVQAAFSPALTDNCNVNVTRLGDDLVALTETPLPVRFDAATLRAAGVSHAVPGQLTVAHPHRDPVSGDMVTYAVQLGRRSRYRIYAQPSRDERRPIAEIPVDRPAYMHSFAITERHVVLAEFPLVVNPLALALSGRPYIENYRWRPERGTRYLVVDRASGELRARLTGEPLFAFHHVNAYEDGDELVLDMCAYEDAAIVDALYLDAVRRAERPWPAAELRRVRLAPGAGTVREQRLVAGGFELPRISYRRANGRPYRYAWGVAGEPGSPLAPQLIVKVDVRDGERSEWAGDGLFPGEPVFVPEPGARAEDAGVLLSVVLDGARERSSLLVLDARDLRELARAEVDHHIPFGFHGQHFPDVQP